MFQINLYSKLKHIFHIRQIFRKFVPFSDNVEKYGRARQAMDDNIRVIRHMHMATNTHSEYVILIAFPLQQWLHELASALRYTCIAFLVIVETKDVCCNCRILTVVMKQSGGTFS